MMYCNKYRTCLLMVAIAATVGGILYWCSSCKEASNRKGMWEDQMRCEERKSGTTIKSAAKNTGKEIKRAATNVSQEMKHAATSVGHEWKEAAKNVGREVKHEFTDEE